MMLLLRLLYVTNAIVVAVLICCQSFLIDYNTNSSSNNNNNKSNIISNINGKHDHNNNNKINNNIVHHRRNLRSEIRVFFSSITTTTTSSSSIIENENENENEIGYHRGLEQIDKEIHKGNNEDKGEEEEVMKMLTSSMTINSPNSIEILTTTSSSSQEKGESNNKESMKVIIDGGGVGTTTVVSSRKSRAIVHVGPHKTGSTTIQSMITKLQYELQQDGYYMPGTWPMGMGAVNMHDLVHCYVTANDPDYNILSQQCNTTLYNDFISLGRNNNNNSTNILLTAEDFSYNYVDLVKLKQSLRPWDDNIIIVINYRRFFQWCVSYYNMITRYELDYSKRKSYYDFITNIDELDRIYSNNYPLAVVHRWKEQFETNTNNNTSNNNNNIVKVNNMHDPSSGMELLETFFCDTIPDASNTCTKLMERKNKLNGKNFMKINPSLTTLFYAELAYEAYKLGILKVNGHGINDIDQQQQQHEQSTYWDDIIKKVQYHQEVELGLTYMDFQPYIICPNQTIIDTILNMSLYAEQNLFPDFYQYSQYGENALRNEFDSYIASNKFCTANATAILLENNNDSTNNGWVEFFKSLL